ncbi:MAG: putative GNAT family N-acyltransferase [Paraglaciecola sp.]|jgi:predicted GNAT family N-acyltransferase
MKFIDQFTQDNIEQVYGLYQQVWWGTERTLDDIQTCISGSQVCIGIINQENVVIAFTRVISDFIYKAIIFDVIVSEAHRDSGLGKELLAAVKNHTELKQVKHFELYCLPELESFYQQFGFSTEVGGIKLMRWVNA